MEKIDLLQEEKIFSKIDIFNFKETATFMNRNNYGVLILLDFIKANDWPKKGEAFTNENPEVIPIIWSFFYVDKNENILMEYDIHPMKCFPNRFMKNNTNSKIYPVIITKELMKDRYVTPGACRNTVHINKRKCIILEKNPEYCSIFGLPHDCYDKDFEVRMKKVLESHKDITCWVFCKNDYIDTITKDILNVKYMKNEFLPKNRFFYNEHPSEFLKAIFSNAELENLNKEISYSSGKDIIDEMDLDYKFGFRYEEISDYFIKKRLIYEFIREILLLKNKENFSIFRTTPSPFDFDKYEEISARIDKIINKIETNSNFYIRYILNEMLKNKILDQNKLKNSRFMVFDIEYLPVTYPTDRIGTINFPCIFSNIIWEGIREGFKTEIVVYLIPCHICKEQCKEFNSNKLKFNCISNTNFFISKQIEKIEKLLTIYDGFKIYSYGKSDIHQLEQSEYFFSDSDQYYGFKRKNRKKIQRIIDIAEDLSIKNVSLEEIEKTILEKWLLGWSRKTKNINKNNRFMTKYVANNWESNYSMVINACVEDSISALLFLIHRDYLSLMSQIDYKEPQTLENF